MKLRAQADGQHLGLEGPGEFRPAGDALAIGEAEFAAAVDGGGAHQIADGRARPRRAVALGEGCHHGIEQPHASVGAEQHISRIADAAGFLARHVGGEPRDIGLGRIAVEQREGRVPGFGDDAVGTFVRREFVAEGDER